MFGYANYGYEMGEWPLLNRATGGIHKHKMQMLIARMKEGKSMLAAAWLALVASMCPEGQMVRVVTLEMTREAYIRRMAAIMAKIVDPTRIQQGIWDDLPNGEQLYQDYLTALDVIANLNIEFLDTPSDIVDIENFVANAEVPTFWWVLDHVGLVRMPNIGGRNGTPDHAGTANELMRICHQHSTGLMIGHANRASAKGIPGLENIAHTDQYGRNVDEIFMLTRPFKTMVHDSEEEGDIETYGEPALLRIIMRDGQGGDVMLWWSSKLVQFVEVPENLASEVGSKIMSLEKARQEKAR